MRSVVQEEKIMKETILLANLFLQTNASDIELSKMTGISSSTVGRRLTNMQNILKVFPKNGLDIFEQIRKKRKENLAKGKALGGQTTLLNHIYNNDKDKKFVGNSKLRLDIIYSDEENQYKFLVHIALYFRLHLETLKDLFQIDEKELLEKLLNVIPGAYNAIIFLLFHDNKDQIVAKEKFIDYYRELNDAIRTKNKKEKNNLIKLITDAKAVEVKKNRDEMKKNKIVMPLSYEEAEIFLKYQLKYSLSIQHMAELFDINENDYYFIINKILEKKENFELKSDYYNLNNYN